MLFWKRGKYRKDLKYYHQKIVKSEVNKTLWRRGLNRDGK